VADDPDTTDPVAALPAALAYTLGGDQGVKNPALAEKYLTERRARSAKYAADYEDVMSQRQAEVENAKRILDSAAEAMRAGHTGAGPWQMNLPMLQMAAGFFKPTKTGNFGEEFGNALTGLGAGVAHQRMSNVEFEKGMADLATKRSTLVQEPLKDRAALLKAQQLADEQGVRALEVAQVKTAGGDNKTTALYKNYVEWAKDPKNAGKTQADYEEHQAELRRQKTANQKELEDLQKKMPGATIDDLYRIKAREAAAGKQTGEDQAKAANLLPALKATTEEVNRIIEEMVVHPGMANAVGRLWATAPGIPGQPKADFEAIEQNLLGRVFMRAYEALRGAGAITEAEGLKATASELPTSRKQSKEAYIRNLRQYQKWMAKGLEIADQKAGVLPTSPPTSAAPSGSSGPKGPWSNYGGGG